MSNIKLKDIEQLRTITSREYKLMLKPSEFTDYKKGIKKIWSKIKEIANELEYSLTIKKQKEIKIKTTEYIDTPKDFLLRKNNLILRRRKEDDGNYKVTLKYRSNNRHIASNVNILNHIISDNIKTEVKFEEDIIISYKKYSLSASYMLDSKPEIEKITKIIDYNLLRKQFNLSNKIKIETVNNFQAHERTHWLGKIKFDNGHTVKFCINYWYKNKNHRGSPILVELSFDYDLISKKDKKKGIIWPKGTREKYHVATVKSAQSIFYALQKKTDWINLKGTTKTAYAYDQEQPTL